MGPLFGAVLARALDAWWDGAGPARPFVVVDAGAGPGTLARAVLAAEPAVLAAGALRYVAVERVSRAQRAAPRRPSPSNRCRIDRPSAFESVWSWPTSCSTTCRSAWPCSTADGGRRTSTSARTGGSSRSSRPFDRVPACLPAVAPHGARAPVQDEAAGWVGRHRGRAAAGARVVVLDYARTTAEMAARPWREWLRTYRAHERGGHYLAEPGTQDITADVALDQLPRDRPPSPPRPSSSAATAWTSSWRRAGGAGEPVPPRPTWPRSPARSRIREAEALTDPAGLGAFTVAAVGRDRLISQASGERPARFPQVRAAHLGVPPMADEPTQAIDDLLLEDRTFPPPEEFKEASLVAGTFMYDEAATDYQGFWARQAAALLDWDEEWDTICEWELPFAQWFIGGKLNVARNCLDRHVEAGRGDKVAFYWEGEPGDTPRRSPTPSCWTRSSASPTCSRASAWSRATGSTSTCR